MLPVDVFGHILHHTDASTRIALRLTCRALNKDFPCSHTGVISWLEQCVIDGHEQLFWEVLSIGHPLLSSFYTQAIRAGSLPIVKYLVAKKVAQPEDIVFTCLRCGRPEFILYLQRDDVSFLSEEGYDFAHIRVTRLVNILLAAIEGGLLEIVKQILVLKRDLRVAAFPLLRAARKSPDMSIYNYLKENLPSIRCNHLDFLRLRDVQLYLQHYKPIPTDEMLSATLQYRLDDLFNACCVLRFGTSIGVHREISLLNILQGLEEKGMVFDMHTGLIRRIIKTGEMALLRFIRYSRQCVISRVPKTITLLFLEELWRLFPDLFFNTPSEKAQLIKQLGLPYVQWLLDKGCKAKNLLFITIGSRREDCFYFLLAQGVVLEKEHLMSSTSNALVAKLYQTCSVEQLSFLPELLHNPYAAPLPLRLLKIAYARGVFKETKEKDLLEYCNGDANVLSWLRTP